MEINLSQFQAGSVNGSSNQIKSVSADPKTPREISAKRSAEEFEAIFISQMLKSMSVGIKTDGPFGGGHSEEIYRDLMNEQLGGAISKSGGIGISDTIYRELLKNQEVSK